MENKQQKKKGGLPVCAIWWQDAAYYYEKKLPDELPPFEITIGITVVKTSKYSNIATNINYDKKDNAIGPVDGIVIPRKVIKKIEKVGLFHNE